MNRNINYRAENFFSYIKLHKSAITSNFLNFGWIFVVGAIFVMFTISFSYLSTIFLLFFIFWSFVTLNGHLLLNYNNFKKSSKIYSTIEPFLQSKKINIKVETIYEEIGLMKRLNHYGKYEISIGNYADIFETEKSIFIFPFKNKKLSDKSWPKIIEIGYNMPIRLTKNIKEKFIYNEININTFRNYKITKIDKNTIVEFKDKIFNTKIKLTLINYENQLTL